MKIRTKKYTAMRKVIFISCLLIATVAFSQKEEKAKQEAARIANNLVYEANKELEGKEFTDAEVNFRKAISKDGENSTAKYNLGNAYYRENSLGEAFSRFKQSSEVALSKAQKHKAFHNMGNVFMKNEEYDKAVEAYKESLRNDPTDDETRYNLALAKQKKEQQGGGGDNNDQNQDQKDQDKKDQDKKEGDNEDKDKEGDKKDDEKKDGEDDKKEGDKKPDENKDGEGDKKEDKKDQNKGGDQPKDEKEEPKKPRPNQLSPQQVKNLLEAMNNQEKKVQEKLNKKKVKGVPVKNEKDW